MLVISISLQLSPAPVDRSHWGGIRTNRRRWAPRRWAPDDPATERRTRFRAAGRILRGRSFINSAEQAKKVSSAGQAKTVSALLISVFQGALRKAAGLGRRLLLAAFLICPVTAALSRPVSTTFYVAAHPDDWQLFETPNAFYDVLNPRNKTVFICFTAGDAGAGAKGLSSKGVPFFLARENGSKRSVRFVVGLTGHRLDARTSMVVIHGHAINRYAVGRTVSYFLRLPDGNLQNGDGYPSTGMQSLKRLHEGAIGSLSAIDGSATYRSWGDLVATVTALIRMEAQGSPTVWVNTLDPDRKINRYSHPDHYQVGMAMRAAIAHMPCINLALFVDYRKAALPANLSPANAYMQAATFGALVSAVVDAGFPSQYRRESRWLGRSYFRTIKGSGRCTWPAVRRTGTSVRRTGTSVHRTGTSGHEAVPHR